MNATIEKIIGLLFEDLEDSEEVRAIHEEICTNCQERYEDMMAMGMTQDEAIHAVVESLSGMEEMLRPYPRRKAREEKPETFGDADECVEEQTHFEINLSKTPVSELQLLHMGSTDIEFCNSADNFVHIDCEDAMPISADVQGGVLTISLKSSPNSPSTIDYRASKGILDSLFSNLFRGLNFSAGGGTLKIAMPAQLRPSVNIETTSGDFSAANLEFDDIVIVTHSGDIRLRSLKASTLRCVTASGDSSLEDIQANVLSIGGTSGDAHAEGISVTGETRINTTSGDVRWTGDSPTISISTVSGDIDHAAGVFSNVQFKTVSGDASLQVLEGALTALDGKTTSGDVRLKLPADQSYCFKCRSVSGDIRNVLPADPASPVVVSVVTSSGDISIR